MGDDEADVKSGKDLFSASFYGSQCGRTFSSLSDAWEHYLKYGFNNGHEPAPHFLSRWYRWQNPDCEGYASVLDHFVTVGRNHLIDPSPFIDLKRIGQCTGLTNSIDAYRLLSNTEFTSKEGYFSDYGVLERNQAEFVDSIAVNQVLDRTEHRKSNPRKRLVWVQIGPNSEFLKWFDKSQPRRWDLLCNWYAFDAMDLSVGELAFAQRGTKFTGIAKVMEQHPAVLDGYEQILLIDDDLGFDFSSIDRLFDIAEQEELSLFQAALTPDSFGIWPDIKRSTSEPWLPFNTIEIMMPGFSMPFLRSAMKVFNQSVSGFGIDLVLGKLAAQAGLNVGVVFDVRAKHFKPIDDASGAYYDYMRRNGINPKLELWKLVQEYDCDLNIKALDKKNVNRSRS